jgi:hypothetical protein
MSILILIRLPSHVNAQLHINAMQNKVSILSVWHTCSDTDIINKHITDFVNRLLDANPTNRVNVYVPPTFNEFIADQVTDVAIQACHNHPSHAATPP